MSADEPGMAETACWRMARCCCGPARWGREPPRGARPRPWSRPARCRRCTDGDTAGICRVAPPRWTIMAALVVASRPGRPRGGRCAAVVHGPPFVGPVRPMGGPRRRRQYPGGVVRPTHQGSLWPQPRPLGARWAGGLARARDGEGRELLTVAATTEGTRVAFAAAAEGNPFLKMVLLAAALVEPMDGE